MMEEKMNPQRSHPLCVLSVMPDNLKQSPQRRWCRKGINMPEKQIPSAPTPFAAFA